MVSEAAAAYDAKASRKHTHEESVVMSLLATTAVPSLMATAAVPSYGIQRSSCDAQAPNIGGSIKAVSDAAGGHTH